MSRIIVGMLVAATAGALGWWANYRASASRQATAFTLQEPLARPNATSNPADKMIVVPQGDIDPKMVRTMPDVDPKIVVSPPWPAKPLSDTLLSERQ